MKRRARFILRFLACTLAFCSFFEALAFDIVNLGADVTRQRKTDLAGNGDYDDQKENLQFKVKITNTDLSKSLDGARAKIWVFGESTTLRGKLKVFSVDEKPLSLGTGKVLEFETTSVANVYDNNAFAKYGAKYSGWVVVVYDATGKIVFQKASSERYAKNTDKLAGVKADTFCDRDYKPISSFY